MSERFAKKWEAKRGNQPFTNRIKEAVNPPGPLKPRLDFAVRRIELQVQKLDQATERFSQRDKAIFARIVNAYTKHDTARANVFANELAEVRKMEQLIINARLALEQIVLRLRTVSELGDVVSTLGPAVGVLRLGPAVGRGHGTATSCEKTDGRDAEALCANLRRRLRRESRSQARVGLQGPNRQAEGCTG